MGAGHFAVDHSLGVHHYLSHSATEDSCLCSARFGHKLVGRLDSGFRGSRCSVHLGRRPDDPAGVDRLDSDSHGNRRFGHLDRKLADLAGLDSGSRGSRHSDRLDRKRADLAEVGHRDSGFRDSRCSGRRGHIGVDRCSLVGGFDRTEVDPAEVARHGRSAGHGIRRFDHCGHTANAPAEERARLAGRIRHSCGRTANHRWQDRRLAAESDL